ncbi:hypothetical protein [Lutibacter sp.]
MKKFILLLKYYISISPIPLIFSILLSIQVKKEGIGFIIMGVIIKVIILFFIWFLEWVSNRKKEHLYFYFNQGVSRNLLYTFTLFIDIFIFLTFTFILWLF